MDVFRDAMIDAIGLVLPGERCKVGQFGYYESKSALVPIRSEGALVEYLKSKSYFSSSKKPQPLQRFWAVVTNASAGVPEEAEDDDRSSAPQPSPPPLHLLHPLASYTTTHVSPFYVP